MMSTFVVRRGCWEMKSKMHKSWHDIYSHSTLQFALFFLKQIALCFFTFLFYFMKYSVTGSKFICFNAVRSKAKWSIMHQPLTYNIVFFCFLTFTIEHIACWRVQNVQYNHIICEAGCNMNVYTLPIYL